MFHNYIAKLSIIYDNLYLFCTLYLTQTYTVAKPGGMGNKNNYDGQVYLGELWHTFIDILLSV